MTTHQLRFGAYWDAIPPFYSTQGLPPLPESNYDEFTDTSNLMPVEMPRDLALKFLWQVRSVTIKLEYEFDPKNENGWNSSIEGLATDQISVIESQGPFLLENAAIQDITSRELRIPQGYIGHYFEPYPEDMDEARGLAREGFGPINPFTASDYADFTIDKTLLIPAIDAEATLVKEKLANIKALATASNYFTLKEEIERQETSFDLAVIGIKQKYQDKLDEITAEYNDGIASETRKIYYGKTVQTEKDRAVFEVRQEAQLQWFDWEGVFDRQVNFSGVGKYRIQSSKTLHYPPTVGGLFGGIYQTSQQKAALSNECVAVLAFPKFVFQQIGILFAQEFTYDRQVLIEPEEATTVQTDGELNVYTSIDPSMAFSTKLEKAAALKIDATGVSVLYGGYYESTPQSGPPSIYYAFINYDAIFNQYTQDVKSPLPDFPQQTDFPSQEISDVVLSGDFFGGGGYDAATEKFQPIADKIRELKEIGNATENGTLEFRDKNDNLLFETPIFAKDVVPIKNVRLTYKIDKLYTDPLDT